MMSADILRILQQLGHNINRAVKIPCPEIQAVPAIVGEDGCPACALLFEHTPKEAVLAVRRYLPVRILPQTYSTPYDVEQLPELTQTTRAKWLQAFGEWRTAQHWAGDPRCQVNYKTLLRRLDQGWDGDRAVTAPVAEQTRRRTGRTLYKHASGPRALMTRTRETSTTGWIASGVL